MTRTAPFFFNKDFRAVGSAEQIAEPTVPQEQYDADVAQAEQRGYEQGVQQGRQDALVAEAARMAQAVERLGMALGQAFHASELRAHHAEAQAVELAVSCALKMANEAVRHYPMAALEAAARASFTEARQSPHVVVRGNDMQVEAIKAALTPIAAERGFAGKMVVLGDPDIAVGDGRIEWADGGFVHERAATEALVRAAVDKYLAALGPSATNASGDEGTDNEH